MLETVLHPTEKTLGEFIRVNYPDYKVDLEGISLETDITHGLEFELYDKGETLYIYPYVKFTDGGYRAVYFDFDYRVRLSKRR